MMACTDVYYRSGDAIAACVIFRGWSDWKAEEEIVERVTQVEPYEPGRFYKRELPCLLKVLEKTNHPLDLIIVDGYVHLDDSGTPGLGAFLHMALNGTIPVMGVAKSKFNERAPSTAVFRGLSRRPLYVSVTGMDLSEAAEKIENMHGPFRIPTLLKRVDHLCRRGWNRLT